VTQPLLKAPFPWYGGKSRATGLIWPRFGDTVNYVEPFCGSCAVLLNRPHKPKNETVNDLDCFIANFWRALQHDPSGVCRYCDWPVNEADLHSRHAYLLDQLQNGFRERMLTDPHYFDVKIAGWWVWGLCCWIGGEWCSESVLTKTGRTKRLLPHSGTRGANRKRPLVIKGGTGVYAMRPRIDRGGRGVTKTWQQKPQAHGQGVTKRSLDLLEYLTALSDRLRRVVVCCGDWTRVLTPVVTTAIGLTSVLLDPPYGADAGRDPTIYAEEDLDVAAKVRDWAVANGDNPLLRIALCGYEGEHEMPDSWECVAWQAHPINNKKQENHKRERIWFSPYCLRPQAGLFDSVDTNPEAGTAEEARHAPEGLKARDGRGQVAPPVRRDAPKEEIA
jgi:site-specific DNA-adenine methylase